MHSRDMTLMCFSFKNQGSFIILARSLSMNCDNAIAFDSFVLFTIDEDLIPGILHQYSSSGGFLVVFLVWIFFFF